MDQQTEQVSYEIWDTKRNIDYPLLDKVYKSSCTQQCLNAFTEFLSEHRDSLVDHKHRLAGVAHSQLGLYSVERIRRENRLPFQLLEMFKHNLDQHLTNFCGEKPWTLYSMWVNYMRSCDFQPLHHHGGDLSFVWYIDVPTIIYQKSNEYVRSYDPDGGRSPYGEIHFVSDSLEITTMQPQTGDLLIFDAGYYHTVYPFREDVERISISGNINYEDVRN